MSVFTPLPPAAQPPWLAQLHQVVEVYAAGPFYVLQCRWCDEGWTLPQRYRTDTHYPSIMDLARHGLQHAVDGDLRLSDDGEPLAPEAEEDGIGWPN